MFEFSLEGWGKFRREVEVLDLLGYLWMWFLYFFVVVMWGILVVFCRFC